ncbi:MAG: response regulator [Pseudomonadota bacterium]
MSSILVLEDDRAVLHVVHDLLCIEGHEVTPMRSGEGAVAAIEAHAIDLVITDLIMPDRHGHQVILDIRRNHTKLPIIAISGDGDLGEQGLNTALLLGANAKLDKPFSREQLISTVSAVLH